MTYIPNVISTVLFESDSAAVHKIPPGDKWELNEKSEIWKGSLRLIEQEIIFDENDSESANIDGVRSAFEGLRAKIELYNINNNEDVVWGEVWYNPVLRDSKGARIANNGQETIQMRHSMRDYKIIGQLPGSGYHPIMNDETDSNPNIQIGLALRLEQFLAISFLESLSLYKRRFKNYQDQFETRVMEPPPTPVLLESQDEELKDEFEQHTNTNEDTVVEGSNVRKDGSKVQRQRRDNHPEDDESGTDSFDQSKIEIESVVDTHSNENLHQQSRHELPDNDNDNNNDNENLTEMSDDDFGDFVST